MLSINAMYVKLTILSSSYKLLFKKFNYTCDKKNILKNINDRISKML